jgi:hypothetical protein
MAGEGSLEERGRSPLSDSFPISNIIKMEQQIQIKRINTVLA